MLLGMKGQSLRVAFFVLSICGVRFGQHPHALIAHNRPTASHTFVYGLALLSTPIPTKI